MILFIGLDGLSYHSFLKYKSYFTFLNTNEYPYVFQKNVQCSFPPSSEPNWSGIVRGVPASRLSFTENRRKWKKAKEMDQMVHNNIFTDFHKHDYITCSITNWDEFYGDVVDEKKIDIPIYVESINDVPMILDEFKNVENGFVFLLIKDIDHVAHRYGENSEQYKKTLKHINQVLYSIVNFDFIDSILITSDHGRDAPDGFEHFHNEPRTMTIPLIFMTNKDYDLKNINYNYDSYFVLNQLMEK